MLKEIIAVFIGGGIGSTLRYLISKSSFIMPSSFPYSTFITNIIGCFILGLTLGYFLKNNNNLSPILLMDDIFDKLDIERVKNIVDLVNSSVFGQLFVSDTDKTRIKKVLKSLKNSSKIFEI